MELYFATLLKFAYTIFVVFILTRFLYYPNNGKKEYLFTYILLATIIALLCIMISRVEISFGFALGIFAIFSLIRYRTAPIEPREMTYIFLSTGIAAKNLLAPDDIEYYKLLTTDGAVLVLAGVCEYFLFRHKYTSKTVIYDNMKLIHPDKSNELKADLEMRFGTTDIQDIKIGKIDATKNTATIRLTIKDPGERNYYND